MSIDIPIDQPNQSFKVDLGIPVECAKYRIILENNVFTLECKSGLTNRLLQKKKVSRTINKTDKIVTFSTNFDATEDYIFNSILDRADISIDDLFLALNAAVKFFESYEVSRKTQSLIDNYISSIGRYTKTWQCLTSKTDYNLTLFRNRTLPYFHLECKDWVKANLESLKGDYPAEITEACERVKNKAQPGKVDDFHEEMSLATRNNNFIEWSVLPIDKYPNMDQLLSHIELMLTIGLRRQALTMIFRSMLSPKDCHIIRENRLWAILNKELANKDINELVRYCMYYAMYILKQEETIMFSQVNIKSRVLFTLEQAADVPPFTMSHIDRTPYIIQLTNDTPLSQTIPFYLHGKRNINKPAEFQRRFNIATGGAFKGINLRELGAAITGSILIPCVQKSPLEEGFDDVDWHRERSFDVKFPYMIDMPETQEDFAFANYLEYYYPSYVSLRDKDFKEQVLGQKGDQEPTVPNSDDALHYDDDTIVIPANFGGIPAPVVEPTPIEVNEEPNQKHKKNLKSKKTIKKIVVDESSELDSDSEEIKKHVESSESLNLSNKLNNDSEVTSFKKILSKSTTPVIDKPVLDDDSKKKSNVLGNNTDISVTTSTIIKEVSPIDPTKMEPTENKSMPNAAEYNQLADIDVSITTRDQSVFKERALKLYDAICENCKHRGPVYIKEVKTIASIKYKLYGPGLPRPMDVFRIPYDPIKMVKKFHVHAVKMFYDGDITMFRSCMSCLLSGVGESYKWFSCNKVPADVLLKYAQRGFSIILNSKERTAISNYIAGHDRWGPMLKDLNIPAEKIYCCVTSRHPFFRPGIYHCGIRLGLRDFERDPSNLYPNILVVSHPKQVFSYGEVITHDINKIYPPNMRLINSVLDTIEYGDDADVNEEIISDPEDD